MRNSLKTRSLVFVFAILSIVLGVNTIFVSLQFISFQRDSLVNKTRIIGGQLREKLERALSIGLPLDTLEGVNESCRDITEGNKEIGYCMLVGRDRRILYHNDPLLAGRFLRDYASEKAAEHTMDLVQSREEDGERYYDISLPLFDSERRLLGSVRLGLKKDAVSEQIFPLIWKLGVIGFFTFVIAAAMVTYFVNRRIVTPIVEMSATASLIARGDWGRRMEIRSRGEVGQLAESFNSMAESLKEREARVQQGYNELEKANEELQKSYAQLEATAGELELKSRHLKEKVGDLSFLHDSTERLRASIDLDDILAATARDVIEGLDYERVMVALVNEKTRTVEERIAVGFDSRERELVCEPLDAGSIFSSAVAERRVQYAAQAGLDSRIPKPVCDSLDLREFAVVPMAGKDRCVGVILVDNRKSSKPMRRDKLDILATFASTSAMAVENAYLYRQLIDNLETVERANRELRSLDQTKTNFLSLASHELRTPLVSVMGYLSLMLSKDLGEINEEQREMLEIAVKGATRLKDIIDDLLMVSKIEGGQLPLKLRWISAADVVEASLAEVYPFLTNRSVRIEKEGLELLPKLEGDFDRLQQSMTNLIGNAVKFTPDGGRVKISGRKVKVDWEKGKLKPLTSDNSILSADTYVEITIEDTGIGIKKENLEKIFEKFYEAGDVDAHSTGKVKFLGGGTGLGLSIVKGVVEKHKGKVWAESDGEDVENCPGSRFMVLIPIKQPVARGDLAHMPLERRRAPAGVPPRPRDGVRPKVLLVEDDEDTITFTKLILEKRYEVYVARDGFEGLRLAYTHRPDLVLLDVWMKGIDGYELCRILKNNEKTANTIVAMFTAAAQRHEMEKGFAAGADDYITKPFSPAELTQRVEKLFGRGAEVS